MTWRRALWGLFILIALGVGWSVAASTCWSARFWYGVHLNECPVGRMQPELLVNAYGLRRGSPGQIYLTPQAVYTYGWSSGYQSTAIHRGDAQVVLQTGSSTIALAPKDGWDRDDDGGLSGAITLPADLPDGRHRLVAEVDTPVGPARATLSVPVFAPARILVMTDRPLYEAGNTVQFRAVVLRAKDQAPLDGRPGDWVLLNPEGVTVYEDSVAAGDYGVVAGDFPLDASAPSGVWTLRWQSGEDFGATTFRVEPFQLPRFTVEATPSEPLYGANDKPVVRGTVRYTSGAPVAEADLELQWRVVGAWPAPPSWTRGGLPKRAKTDARGQFEVKLPTIPTDLRGEVTLFAGVSATDATGDRVTGSAFVRLSEDKIRVSTVTELADGLVEGFNNRLYLRASRPFGGPLPNTSLRVTRAWDPTDKGQVVKTDVDGVAALQIDPGPAVTVVEPGMPVRPPQPPPPVKRVGLVDYLRDRGPALADQSVLDKAQLEPCAVFAVGSQRIRTVVRVASNGTVSGLSSGSSDLEQCAQQALRRLKFPRGRERLFEMSHVFTWSGPVVGVSVEGPDRFPDAFDRRLSELAVRARTCLPRRVRGGRLGQLLAWSVDARGRLQLRTVPEPRRGARQPVELTACILKTLATAEDTTLEQLGVDAPYTPGFGLIRASVTRGAGQRTRRRQNKTYLGYELKVEAFVDDEEIGETKVRLRPGAIPNLRLRASPVVAKPGETVEVKVLRGPQFQGELPKKLVLVNEGLNIEADLDADTRVARFTLPEDRVGWYEVQLYGARAAVFVPEQRTLAVDIAPEQPAYRPGEKARLRIETLANGTGVPAMVGLFGVDETLGQLATLPGPAVWSSLLPVPTMSQPAFGALDAIALASGRVRGDAALEATVLRVTQVPAAADLDRPVSVSVQQRFDPSIPLTDSFYSLLVRLNDRVREWDSEAPEGTYMTPATMAQLWDDVLDAAPDEERLDPFGRRMRLRILPNDLLALVDPRVVVTNGTRLPEDVENWTRWVRRNQP